MALVIQDRFQFNPVQFDGSNPAISYLGTPVVSALQILEGREQTGVNAFEDYEGIIIRSCVIDVSSTKNVVKTVVQGRNGTFKEYISQGDYVVSVKGVLLNENPLDGLPTGKMKVLNRIGQVSEALQVQCELLNQLGIYEIVIESLDFSEPLGNSVKFSISAVSELPIILKEKEK